VPNQRTGSTAARPRTVRLLLVEPQAFVRALLREIVDSQPDIHVVAEAADLDSAAAVVHDEMPDVVLVDMDLPIALMVPAVQQLKRDAPSVQIVLLGHGESDDELFAALQAGVAAQVPDDARPSEVVRAIRAAAGGAYPIDDVVAARPAVARRVLEAFSDASILDDVGAGATRPVAFAPLSGREAELLQAIAQGLTNKAVGERLSITEATVKNHVTNILRKLAVNGRTQAVLYALKHLWISVMEEPPSRPN
jgi:DNA-binding NarL/FixJ family response regulator